MDHTINVIQRLNQQYHSKGEKRIYAFVDITAAFDSVKHDLLLKILQEHLKINIKNNADKNWVRIITDIIRNQY